jgi:hypothetical protein
VRAQWRRNDSTPVTSSPAADISSSTAAGVAREPEESGARGGNGADPVNDPLKAALEEGGQHSTQAYDEELARLCTLANGKSGLRGGQ